MFYRTNTLLVRTVVDLKPVFVGCSRDISFFNQCGLVKKVVGNFTQIGRDGAVVYGCNLGYGVWFGTSVGQVAVTAQLRVAEDIAVIVIGKGLWAPDCISVPVVMPVRRSKLS